MKLEYSRRELTRATGGGAYCVLCGGQGPKMETILHGSDCPMIERYVLSVTVKRVTDSVKFTAWKHHRWSWWSASGARYHVEDTGDDFSLILDESIDVIHSEDSVEALRTWIEANQGVL